MSKTVLEFVEEIHEEFAGRDPDDQRDGALFLFGACIGLCMRYGLTVKEMRALDVSPFYREEKDR